ncbi:MAG: hypothetical protein LBN96_01575 [Desulfovibrio sp.]|jgi:hypothetical protein|nr:hypothetical protein [Desulfovibrio sp.]
MADINLVKPSRGERQVARAGDGSRIVLNFPADQATMEKDGDNLVFGFDDGGSVVLENFYQRYNAEAIPEFEVEGQIVAGADFFTDFGPDLAPAAGPGGSSGGGRYQDYANMYLADGLGHLGQMDWNYTDPSDTGALAGDETGPAPVTRSTADTPLDDADPVADNMVNSPEPSGYVCGPVGSGNAGISWSDWGSLADTNEGYSDGLSRMGWWGSDPGSTRAGSLTGDTDIWQDHLFDIINAADMARSISGYGSDKNEYTDADNGWNLYSVPKVPGAGGNYLHMKDCAEFDTQDPTTYSHDAAYLSFAFGLPAGKTGASANAYIDNILINTVGIKTVVPHDDNDLSATGNANGLHAHNDYDWNLISKQISGNSGTTLKFGWSFAPGQTDVRHVGKDAAFWTLLDKNTGKIVDSGVLAQGKADSGIAEITLPADGNYVLTIGQMNVGDYGGSQARHNPHLVIGDVVQQAGAAFEGDLLPDNADHLASFTWAGKTCTFDSGHKSHTITNSQGILTISDDGHFTFTPYPGVNAGNVHAQGAFTVTGSTGSRDFILDGRHGGQMTPLYTATGSLVNLDDDHTTVDLGDGRALTVHSGGRYEYSADDDGTGLDFTCVLIDKDGDKSNQANVAIRNSKTGDLEFTADADDSFGSGRTGKIFNVPGVDAADDAPHGGAGNDMLLGGGDDMLFGGAGNGVMRYHAGDTIDGGGNLDFLLVGDGQADIGDILGTGAVRNVEFIVWSGDETWSDLTSMGDIITALNRAGLEITENGQVTGIGPEWSASHNAANGYFTFTDEAISATVAVFEAQVGTVLQEEILKSDSSA